MLRYKNDSLIKRNFVFRYIILSITEFELKYVPENKTKEALYNNEF